VEEACNRGDLAVLDELSTSPTHLGRLDQPGQWPEATPGAPVRRRLRELLLAFRGSVPDARWTVLEQVAAGGTVVTRLAVQGNFSGPLLRLAPPGRPATLTGVAICRFERGRLVEVWLQADLLGLLQQLGVLPPLSLTQAVTMAQVLHAGTLLADGRPP
jgi:predicted ester cyclase